MKSNDNTLRSSPVLLVAAALVLILSACSSASPGAGSTPVVQPTAAVVQPTEALAQPSSAAPVNTTAPTAAPVNTTAPTAAPVTTSAPTETTAPTAAAEAAATPAPNAVEAPTGDAALVLFLEVSKAQLAQKAWRATMNASDGAKETTTIIEYVSPGSFHVKTDESEILIVEGEGTFLKDGDVWQKSPMDMSGMMSEFLTQQNIEEMLKQTKFDTLNYEGSENLDGKPMWVYTYTTSIDAGGATVAADTKMWIGARDKLPYRYETTSKVGDASTTSVVEYEYDPGITIEAPDVAS